jgi:Fur family zinc uptake transcriptional regulator
MTTAAGKRQRRTHESDHLVEAVLGAAKKPLSTYEIRDCIVAGGERISVPQIYRVVARLEAKQRIRRVETLNAYITGGAHEDAVAICKHCATATPMPIGDLMQQVSALIRARGFKIEDVIIEARGRCARCLFAEP